MKVTYIGCDMAKETFNCVVLKDEHELRKICDNSHAGFRQFLKWLRSTVSGPIVIVLEPTGRYSEGLAEFLAKEANITVLEVQPYKFRKYAQSLNMRIKSDWQDAYALARYGQERASEIKPWRPKSDFELESRDLQLLIRSLVKQSNSLKSQRKCGLRSQFVTEKIDEQINQCEVELRAVLQYAEKLLKSHPIFSKDLRLLVTIPGIGIKSAVLLLTLIDFRRFRSSRSLACFLGLTQRKNESGTSVKGKESISKRGSKHIRSGLFMPARSARLGNVFIIEFADRLAENHKHDTAIQIAVIRKMVTMSWALVTKQMEFDPAYQNPHLSVA